MSCLYLSSSAVLDSPGGKSTAAIVSVDLVTVGNSASV